MDLEALYLKAPLLMQNLLCSAQGFRINNARYSKFFWDKLRIVEARREENIFQFRDRRLQSFVQYAVENVYYYKDLFARLKIDSRDIKSIADLNFLPILTKDQIRNNPELFLSSCVRKKDHVLVRTSGTTGSGFHFITTAEAQQEQWAIWWRYWRRHNLKYGEWCGLFGGRSVVPSVQTKKPFWRVNYPGRQVIFSAYHTTPENLNYYLLELRRRKLLWLHGYPSQLALIAAYIVENGFDLGYRPKWITTGAESLLPHQIKVIEEGFGIKPLQHYGLSEAVANISEDIDGTLRVDEDFAGVEFIKSDIDGFYRIVGTNFSNLAMPLIRYDTGDYAEILAVADNDGCGRVVHSLDGRREDYVVTKIGAKIGRMDHIFKDMINVKEAQIRQKKIGEIDVLIVKSGEFSLVDQEKLKYQFFKRLGNEMDINFLYVDRLERTNRGKLRFVINDIPNVSVMGRV